MKSKQKHLKVILLSLIGLGCFTPLFWLWLKYVEPYSGFRQREIKALPLFDALNNSVLGEIPPPVGVTPLPAQTQSVGIDGPHGFHGRTLRVVYEFGSLSAENILAYYEMKLTSNGWTKYQGLVARDQVLYIRDTGCVRLTLFEGELNDIPNEYSIAIWYDFLKQEFSPPLPDLDLLKFYDLLGAYIVKCPP
jgi:hypothetical protein